MWSGIIGKGTNNLVASDLDLGGRGQFWQSILTFWPTKSCKKVTTFWIRLILEVIYARSMRAYQKVHTCPKPW